jgi:hypothetical protein
MKLAEAGEADSVGTAILTNVLLLWFSQCSTASWPGKDASTGGLKL